MHANDKSIEFAPVEPERNPKQKKISFLTSCRDEIEVVPIDNDDDIEAHNVGRCRYYKVAIKCRGVQTVMVFIRSERSGHSRPPLQKCCKAAPRKKCREAFTTVVLNQGGFNEVVSRVRWTLSDILTYYE